MQMDHPFEFDNFYNDMHAQTLGAWVIRKLYYRTHNFLSYLAPKYCAKNYYPLKSIISNSMSMMHKDLGTWFYLVQNRKLVA